MATPMPEPIDFAEHGRLLVVYLKARNSSAINEVDHARDDLSDAAIESIEAYRAVVLAAKARHDYATMSCPDYDAKYGSGFGEDEIDDMIASALARFENVGEVK